MDRFALLLQSVGATVALVGLVLTWWRWRRDLGVLADVGVRLGRLAQRLGPAREVGASAELTTEVAFTAELQVSPGDFKSCAALITREVAAVSDRLEAQTDALRLAVGEVEAELRATERRSALDGLGLALLGVTLNLLGTLLGLYVLTWG